MKRLKRINYRKNAVELAKFLIGSYLCIVMDGEVKKYKILETEAYCGEEDTACHAHKGRTKRTEVMYGEAGLLYVYLCYGIHNLLNIVCGEKELPHAVLIRSIEGFDGPGKLTKHLEIDRSFNYVDLVDSKIIWIESDFQVKKIKSSKRIGIDYASLEYKNKNWRFLYDY